MAKSYVKFETPADVQQKALQVVEAATASGGIRRHCSSDCRQNEQFSHCFQVPSGFGSL